VAFGADLVVSGVALVVVGSVVVDCGVWAGAVVAAVKGATGVPCELGRSGAQLIRMISSGQRMAAELDQTAWVHCGRIAERAAGVVRAAVTAHRRRVPGEQQHGGRPAADQNDQRDDQTDDQSRLPGAWWWRKRRPGRREAGPDWWKPLGRRRSVAAWRKLLRRLVGVRMGRSVRARLTGLAGRANWTWLTGLLRRINHASPEPFDQVTIPR
jgi:hypothetical protein